MSFEVPTSMQALVVKSWGELELREVPVPVPSPTQVLVRVAASPINPADLLFAEGNYPANRPLPAIGGNEGSGTVVAAGAGEAAQALLGLRVGCAAGSGIWSEYAAVEAGACFILPPEVSDEQGAMLFANPLSALALLSIAQKQGIPAIIQTAAAGALGRMLERLGQRYGIAVINLVRRSEQVDLLRQLGAEHVLNTGQDGWQKSLAELARKLDARLAFDAVGGELTGEVLACMPNGSHITVYGLLSLEDCRIRLDDLVFRQKSVDGFWLGPWLRAEGLPLQHWRDTLIDLVQSDLGSEVQAAVPLGQGLDAIEAYRTAMSKGKVLLLPGRK